VEDKLKDHTQMIYKFAQVYYLFVVKKVDTIKATGYRKAARLLKVVFEAYRRDDKGDPLRCEEERIAQHFYQVFSNGYWHTQDDHDHRILEALGLPPTLDHSLDLEKRLNGRWIEGLPGPPDPDGFNPLEEFKAIQSPVPTVFHPAPPASGVASTSAVSLADSSASAECPNMTDRPCRSAEMAYQAYQHAERNIGARVTDKEAYAWLRENGLAEYPLPSYENWARYLREGRRHYHDQKNGRRAGRSGRSIVHQSEI
jgi:hypothetical protein